MKENKKKKSELRGWIITILLSVLLSIGIQVFFQINFVSGNSMNPTLDDGEIFISLRTNWAGIERGDIVDINSKSLSYVDSDMLVKRIIGLPGETVLFEDGKVYIDGKQLKEDYIFDNKKDRNNVLNREIKLKKDEYFILGDNRNNSTDSRILGAIKEEHITSKYLFSLPF